MIKRSLKLLLCSFVLALGLLSSMVVTAKDFKLFSLDFGSPWMEVPAEAAQRDGVESLVLMNSKDMTILSISAQHTGKSLTKEEFKEHCQNMIKVYESEDTMITSSKFDDAKGEAVFMGNASGMPFELHMRHQNAVVIGIACVGANAKDAFALADKLRIK